MAYLRKENIKQIIKSLTEKNQLAVPVFLQNKNRNSEPDVSLANNKKHHRDKSSLLAKENNKDTERKNDEKEKPKLKKSSVKKTLILGDSEIKNVDGWRLNRRMKSIVSVRSISGATTKTMKQRCGMFRR